MNRVEYSPRLQQIAAAIIATGFTAFIVLIAVLLITSVDQIYDILIQVDQSSHLMHRVGLVLAGCWFSLICWWSARYVFETMARVNPENQARLATKNVQTVLPPAQGISERTTRFLPRIYAAALPMVILVQALRHNLWNLFFITLVFVLVPVLVLVIYRRKLTAWLEDQFFLSTRRDWFHEVVNPYFWGWTVAVLYGAVAVWALANPYNIGQAFGAFFVVYWGLGSILFQLVVAICVVLPATFGTVRKALIRVQPKWAPRLNQLAQSRLLAPPYPILFIVVIFAGAMSVLFNTDNHLVRRLPVATGYAYPTFDAAWDNFTEQLLAEGLPVKGSGSKEYPVFFVASQGGGLRAAYWATQGLAALETELPGVSHNIFSLAGVSGGSVGNAFYAAALRAGESEIANDCSAIGITDKLPCDLSTAVGQDYLSPVLTSFLYNDMLYRFLPIAQWPFLARDRAEVLETSWENGFKAAFNEATLSKTLQSTYNQAQWVPLLMSMGAHQETGARLITAPFPIDPRIFINHYNVYQLMDCNRGKEISCDMNLSTVALNSARFPYVTPAGTLAAKKSWKEKDHIIDGGYVENYGLMATQAMIHYLHKRNKLTLTRGEDSVTLIPVVLVFANDMDLTPEVLNHQREVPYLNTGSYAFNEITNPIQGIIANRTARSVQSITEAIAWQQEYASAKSFGKFQYVRDPQQNLVLDLDDVVVFQLKEDESKTLVPLGWWLSKQSQAYMARQFHNPGSTPYQLIQEIKMRMDN